MAMTCTCLKRIAQTPLVQSAVASTSRAFSTSSARAAAARSVPEPRGTITTPAIFLKRIGRNMLEHESKVGQEWADFWRKDSEALKAAGIAAPKERKYLLRQMEYYRQGRTITAIHPKQKKKFRGRGARVQKGVRVR